MSFDGYEEPQVVTASNEVKDQLQNIVNRCKSDQCLVDRVKNILNWYRNSGQVGKRIFKVKIKTVLSR